MKRYAIITVLVIAGLVIIGMLVINGIIALIEGLVSLILWGIVLSVIYFVLRKYIKG
jgi:hypothetical protein